MTIQLKRRAPTLACATLAGLLLAGVSTAALAAPAKSDPKLDAMQQQLDTMRAQLEEMRAAGNADAKLSAMQQQLDAMAAQLAEVKGAQSADAANGAVRRLDLARSMARLKPRERDLLWLAYAQGSSHKEIAETLGLKAASIKLLLFRARRRLAGLLREGGR